MEQNKLQAKKMNGETYNLRFKDTCLTITKTMVKVEIEIDGKWYDGCCLTAEKGKNLLSIGLDEKLRSLLNIPESMYNTKISINATDWKESWREYARTEESKKQQEMNDKDIHFIIRNSLYTYKTRTGKECKYTLSNELTKDMFARITKHGKYFSKAAVKEDMFEETGWKFSQDALTELLKTNRVFVDNVEICK